MKPVEQHPDLTPHSSENAPISGTWCGTVPMSPQDLLAVGNYRQHLVTTGTIDDHPDGMEWGYKGLDIHNQAYRNVRQVRDWLNAYKRQNYENGLLVPHMFLQTANRDDLDAGLVERLHIAADGALRGSWANWAWNKPYQGFKLAQNAWLETCVKLPGQTNLRRNTLLWTLGNTNWWAPEYREGGTRDKINAYLGEDMETLNPQWSEYLLGKVQSMPKLTNQQLGRFLDGLLVRFQKELRGMNQAPIQETIVKALRKQNNPLGDMFQEAAENGLAGTTTGGPFYRHPDGLQRPGRVMDQHGIEAGIVMGSLWDTWRGNYDELEQAAIASTVSWQAPKRIKSVKRTNKAERGENHGSQRR